MHTSGSLPRAEALQCWFVVRTRESVAINNWYSPTVCLILCVSRCCSAPIVRSPAGSTSRARCSASDVARSALAGVTARMMAFSPCAERTNIASSKLQSSTILRCSSQAPGTLQLVGCNADHAPSHRCAPCFRDPAQSTSAAHRSAPLSDLQVKNDSFGTSKRNCFRFLPEC